MGTEKRACYCGATNGFACSFDRKPGHCIYANTPPQKVGEWLPIESAPKDGTEILCASKNELGKWRRYIAFYAQPYTLPNGDDNFIDDESEFAPEGWYTDTSDEERVNLCKPTFWMPIPLPPTTAKE